MRKLRTTACAFVATVVAIVSVTSATQVSGQSPTPVPPPEITWGVQIPMRDGVKLHGNLYRPRDTRENLPVIVCISLYAANGLHVYAPAKDGDAFIARPDLLPTTPTPKLPEGRCGIAHPSCQMA